MIPKHAKRHVETATLMKSFDLTFNNCLKLVQYVFRLTFNKFRTSFQCFFRQFRSRLTKLRIPSFLNSTLIVWCLFFQPPTLLLVGACSFNHPPSCLFVGAYSFNHPPSCLLVGACSFDHPLSCLLVDACSFNHPPSCLLVGACSFNHPPSCWFYAISQKMERLEQMS